MIFACTILTHNQPTKNVTSTPTEKCPSLPPTFSKNNLIGVWVVSYRGGDDTDMLILRADNTYKQIYDAPLSNLRYESGWQEWWIEYRESGYLRLHLKGMHLCDDLESICRREGGGLNPTEYTSIDYCENQVVEMQDEVVLVVTGIPGSEISSFPRGITLRQLRIAGSDWTWSFRFQNVEENP